MLQIVVLGIARTILRMLAAIQVLDISESSLQLVGALATEQLGIDANHLGGDVAGVGGAHCSRHVLIVASQFCLIVFHRSATPWQRTSCRLAGASASQFHSSRPCLAGPAHPRDWLGLA